MASSTPVTQALEALRIPYRLHLHQRPPRSLEQAAQERGLEPGQIVRSLLFRLEGGSYVLVLVAGPQRVSWPKLRRFLGVSRLTTASADQVREITGYEPGAVSPFGTASPLRILADRSLMDFQVVSIGAGAHNAGVILQREHLFSALKPELGDFVEGQATD